MAGLEFESIRYKGQKGAYITVKKTGEDIDRNGDPALWDCDFFASGPFFLDTIGTFDIGL